MSDRELQRLEVLQDLDRPRLTPAAAGQLLGLERRQVFRLLKAYRIEGPTGLVSKRARSAQQPAQARGDATRGFDDYSPVVLGFRPRPWRLRSCARIMGSRLAVKHCATG